jgi:phage terminase large subunit GpA-like protein
MLHQSPPKVPPFETGFQIVARYANIVRPKKSLTVSQWAAKHLAYYDPEALPFLAEIMDACSDPETSEVGDQGPAQGGKSMVGEAFVGWSIEHDPEPFMLGQPDKALLESFIKLRINPMIASTTVLKAELAPHVSADNIHMKLFRSGVFLVGVWPVENQFRQRTVCRGWIDDFDGWPEDIEGKGDAVGLLDGRMTIHKGRDTKLVSSSPALADDRGIAAFVAKGTMERLQPVCPECGDRVDLDLIRDLKFDAGTMDEAARSAHVVCPANGCILLPEARHALIASTAHLPHRGFVATRPEAGKFRRTFQRDGLLSFTPWPDLARLWREGQIDWEARQDETKLKTFWNVKAGKNYRSLHSGEKPIAADVLKKRRETTWRLGTVPRGPKVVNIIIDVQHDRFECGAVGSAKDRETWLIDRFAIDVLDDGLTQVAPFTHAEHWKALLPLFDRKYPFAELDERGKPIGHAPVLSLVIDTGGSDRKGDQATAGAKWFWNAAVALGVHPSRITLVKGGSNPKGKLMPPGQFADQKVRGGAKRNSAKLWIPNVHAVKNMIDARLRRPAPGPGYIHLPGDLSDAHVEEIAAEELRDGKWVKIRARNETLDILVYGEVALLRPPFAQSRPDMAWVPKDFRVRWPKSERVAQTDRPDMQTEAADVETAAVETTIEPEQRRQRGRPKPRRAGWMGRLNQGAQR